MCCDAYHAFDSWSNCTSRRNVLCKGVRVEHSKTATRCIDIDKQPKAVPMAPLHDPCRCLVLQPLQSHYSHMAEQTNAE
jgi:hypothetical protein